jgi:hypothetical protein
MAIYSLCLLKTCAKFEHVERPNPAKALRDTMSKSELAKSRYKRFQESMEIYRFS